MGISQTKAEALAWFKANSPVSMFTKDGPSLDYTKRILIPQGLVTKSTRLIPHPQLESAALGVFVLSKLGRRKLRRAERQRA